MSECNLPQALLTVLYRHLFDMLSPDLDREHLTERAEQGLIICRLAKERLDDLAGDAGGGA